MKRLLSGILCSVWLAATPAQAKLTESLSCTPRALVKLKLISTDKYLRAYENGFLTLPAMNRLLAMRIKPYPALEMGFRQLRQIRDLKTGNSILDNMPPARQAGYYAPMLGRIDAEEHFRETCPDVAAGVIRIQPL